jgi:hypothetical protein
MWYARVNSARGVHMSFLQVVGVEQAQRAFVLTEAIARSPARYGFPLGVGFVRYDARLSPLLYIHQRIARELSGFRSKEPVALLPLREPEFAFIQGAIGEDFGERAHNPFDDLLVFVAAPPVAQASPGDCLVTSTTIGTLGSPVAWNGGYGFLTAGHVASAGTAAYEIVHGKSVPLGNVVFSQTASGPGTTGSADVAVIEVASGPAPSNWLRGKVRVAGAGDDVDVMLHSPQTSTLKGMFQWLYFPASKLTFGSVYMTDNQITQQGDSGAVSVIHNTSDVIGHVVGATANVASYIQEIDYQLQAINNANSTWSITI